MPISEWCEKGYVPLPFQTVLSYKFVSKEDQNIFGEYDEEVKKIINEEQWWMGGVGTLGRRPHCRINPNERGFCYFYNSEQDDCKLGDYRPSRCQTT